MPKVSFSYLEIARIWIRDRN